MPSADWTAPTATGPVDARVVLPGSKSLTNRYLVLAALANDVSLLRSPLRSRDTLLMAQALRTLGAVVDDVDDGDWLVTPGRLVGGGTVDCGLAGNVMRFVPAGGRPGRRPGALRRRPARPAAPHGTGARGAAHPRGRRSTTTAAAACRSRSTAAGRCAAGPSPSTPRRPRSSSPGCCSPAPASTRASPCTTTARPVPSLPHIEMTVETLRDAGVVVDDGDVHTWRVEPSEVNALDVQVEPDLSNAAQFLAAALVTNGRVQVPGWPQYTTQGGDFVRDVLDMMGAEVVLDRAGLTVSGGGGISGIDVDLHDSSELTPVVAALCALADSPERHPRGRPHPRARDRPARGPAHRARPGSAPRSTRPTTGCGSRPGPLHGGTFHTYADHRMVMAAAVLGLVVPGLVVEDVDTVAKTHARVHPAVGPHAQRPGRGGRLMARAAGSYDESDVRIRPNRRGTRPRSKDRPAHEDAVPGRVTGSTGAATRPSSATATTATSSSPCGPASSAARASSSATTSASSATPPAPTAAWPASCGWPRAAPCCAAPPTTPTRSSGSSWPTPTSSSSSRPWPTPSRAPG